MTESLLAIENLRIVATHRGTETTLVEDVSLTLESGRVLGVVGESGSGKSITSLSVMGLLPKGLRVDAGSIRLKGAELTELPISQLRKYRGGRVAMIFQNPQSSLTPSMRIGAQITESLALHEGLGRSAARTRAIELLDMVRIPEAARRLRQYPHEFSGGMKQRVMIAMAMSCNPELLIADEPTTALDVTVQAQILDLLQDLVDEHDMGMILVSHDLNVVGSVADAIAVMRRGQLLEIGDTDQILTGAQHPYTRALLRIALHRRDGHYKQPLPVVEDGDDLDD